MVWNHIILLTLVLFTLNVTAAPIPRAVRLTRRGSDFIADSSFSAASVLSAAKAASSDEIARYASRVNKLNNVPIYGDWLKLAGTSAIHFTADMDIDCDGSTTNPACNVDGSRQSATSWGKLDASKVPFFVIPETFRTQHKDVGLKGNDLGAVVCDGKIVYGIFGDENGATPQVIGEGSILLAQTCFPNDHITGSNGHDPLDVLYIVFPGKVPSGISTKSSSIDIGALKTLGDSEMKKLVSAVGGKGSTSGDDSPGGSNDPKSAAPTSEAEAKTATKPANSATKTEATVTKKATKTHSSTAESATSTGKHHKELLSEGCKTTGNVRRQHAPKKRMAKVAKRALAVEQ